jgi:hypothetical protein
MNKKPLNADQILQKAEQLLVEYVNKTLGLNHFKLKNFDANTKNLGSYLLLARQWIEAIEDQSRCVAVLINKNNDKSVCGHSAVLDRIVQAVNRFSHVSANRPAWGNLGRCGEPFAWNKVRNTVDPKDYSNWISVAFGTPTARGKNTDMQLARLIGMFPDEQNAQIKAKFLNQEMPKIWGIIASPQWWSLKPPCNDCRTWVMPDGSWQDEEKLGGAIVRKNDIYQIATKVSDLPSNDYPAEERIRNFFQKLFYTKY